MFKWLYFNFKFPNCFSHFSFMFKTFFGLCFCLSHLFLQVFTFLLPFTHHIFQIVFQLTFLFNNLVTEFVQLFLFLVNFSLFLFYLLRVTVENKALFFLDLYFSLFHFQNELIYSLLILMAFIFVLLILLKQSLIKLFQFNLKCFVGFVKLSIHCWNIVYMFF